MKRRIDLTRIASRIRIRFIIAVMVIGGVMCVHAQRSGHVAHPTEAVAISIRHWTEAELSVAFSNTTSGALSSDRFARNGQWAGIESQIAVSVPQAGPARVVVSVLINSEKRGLELLEGAVNRSHALMVGEPWPVWLFIPPDSYGRWGDTLVVGTKVEVSVAERVVASRVVWRGGEQPWPEHVPISAVELVPVLASPWVLAEEMPSGELVNRIRSDVDQVLLRQSDLEVEQAIMGSQMTGEGSR